MQKHLRATLTAALLCTLGAANASAQNTAPAAPSTLTAGADNSTFAITSLYMPVESAFLRTKADLGFFYTGASFGAGNFSTDISLLALGLDAQVALWDRFEVGLSLPFLTHGSFSFGGGAGDTEFGNISLKLKGLLVGQNHGQLAVSVFANTTLPTGTGLKSREFLGVHGGVAVSSNPIAKLTVGASLGAAWTLKGNDANDGLLLLANIFGGYRFHKLLGAQLAIEGAANLMPSSGDFGVAVLPALQFFPMPNLHLDLGARVAINDTGKFFTPLGRAAFMVAAGYQL